MFNKKKIETKNIEFWAASDLIEHCIEPPVPAKTEIPKWYKDLPKSYKGKNEVSILESGDPDSGLKLCAPFLDAMTSGYIVKLHCDIIVERNENGEASMRWSSQVPPLSPRPFLLSEQLPSVEGFGPFTQAWEMRYGFKVPKGYSILITQPFNRTDLPTYVTSGIIDADELLGPGGVPFCLKENFTGVLKAGTPIIQMFPFKRDDWKSKMVENKFPIGDLRGRNRVYGWYKQAIWKKKDYS
jgi:hypothetical protein